MAAKCVALRLFCFFFDGEVPNLYATAERMEIVEACTASARAAGKQGDGTPAKIFSFFIQQSKANMSIVLCFSPIGDAWRSRLRQFPSLVNCCGIDWYTAWPVDALTAVASRFLKNIDLETEVRDACVEMCGLFHSSASELGDRFTKEAKRFYYATPTSFLELISTFKTLLAERRKFIKDLKGKYDNGLDKLTSTEASVSVMQKELKKNLKNISGT